LQFVKPAAQLPVTQAPFEQICVPVHARPHTPQFEASDATHAPAHSRKPLGHAHVPLLQD
jgi:hypothetical protein